MTPERLVGIEATLHHAYPTAWTSLAQELVAEVRRLQTVRDSGVEAERARCAALVRRMINGREADPETEARVRADWEGRKQP